MTASVTLPVSNNPVVARRVEFLLEPKDLAVEALRLLDIRHGNADEIDALHFDHRVVLSEA